MYKEFPFECDLGDGWENPKVHNNPEKMHHQALKMGTNIILYALNRLTDPFLIPIRRFLPNLGGIDLSPVVLILLLIFFRNLVFEYFYF